ncbi:hypothetical protein UA18_04230 [Burkholderia multivorans]|uniref:Uncharacterized protein n=1 Tax=Burkholderia multivorans TaxID=87883 RepID=A0ABD7L8Q4_9BURK|nr:hypothetical protein UA18_04230 [Burkholderia multivorans]
MDVPWCVIHRIGITTIQLDCLRYLDRRRLIGMQASTSREKHQQHRHHTTNSIIFHSHSISFSMAPTKKRQNISCLLRSAISGSQDTHLMIALRHRHRPFVFASLALSPIQSIPFVIEHTFYNVRIIVSWANHHGILTIGISISHHEFDPIARQKYRPHAPLIGFRHTAEFERYRPCTSSPEFCHPSSCLPSTVLLPSSPPAIPSGSAYSIGLPIPPGYHPRPSATCSHLHHRFLFPSAQRSRIYGCTTVCNSSNWNHHYSARLSSASRP